MLESAPSLSRGSFMQMLPRQDLRLSQRLTLPLKMVLLSPAYFLLRMLKIEPNSSCCTRFQHYPGFCILSLNRSACVLYNAHQHISPTPIFSKLCLCFLIFLTHEFTVYFNSISNRFYLLISHLFSIDLPFYMEAQEGWK